MLLGVDDFELRIYFDDFAYLCILISAKNLSETAVDDNTLCGKSSNIAQLLVQFRWNLRELAIDSHSCPVEVIITMLHLQ